MMHWLLMYLDYISTRPTLILMTCLAVVALVAFGRLRARQQHRG